MTSPRSILVTGATGKQGGSLIASLPAGDFELRALTRKPSGPAAQALARQEVSIIEGDLDDAGSLRKALAGVWGVFAVQNT
jgi:uncharacterized protein YbjT (DUF2867 family)